MFKAPEILFSSEKVEMIKDYMEAIDKLRAAKEAFKEIKPHARNYNDMTSYVAAEKEYVKLSVALQKMVEDVTAAAKEIHLKC